jgi:hypothetical protein
MSDWWQGAPVVERRQNGVNDTVGPSGPPGNEWWKAAETISQIKPQAPAAEFGPMQRPYTGMILPVSSDERGRGYFDPNAGILGPFTRAVRTTQDVAEGKLDPMSKETIPKELEMALIMSPTSVASTAGRTGVATAPKSPTTAELKSAAKAGYKEVDALGVSHSAQAVKSFADDAARALDEEGFIAELSPKTAAILKKLREPPEGSVSSSVRSMDAFRRQLNRVGGSPDPTESAAANMVIRKLDEWLANPDPASLVVGASPAQGAGAANVPRIGGAVAPSAEETAIHAANVLREARGNRAAAFRSDRIAGLDKSAQNRAAATASGQNLGNTIRQRLASLLESNKNTRGFNDEELAAIQQVVDGTATQNTLRYVGNLLGAGGGLGQAVISGIGGAGGAAAGGIPGAAVGAVVPSMIGAASRAGYNRMTLGQLKQLDELIRQRSPLYQQALQNPPMNYSAAPDLGAAYARALMMNQAVGER